MTDHWSAYSPVSFLLLAADSTTQTDISLDARIARNRRQVALLAAGFGTPVFLVVFLILLALGGGWVSLLVAAIVTGVWLGVAWSKADSVVLDLSEVEPADEIKHARLFNVSAGMCVTVGTSAPTLYVVEDTALNSMSVGRDPRHASLIVTTGLIEELTVVELEAVVAFELVRIKLGDIAPQTFLVPTVAVGPVLAESADRFQWLQRLLSSSMPIVERVLLWMHSNRKDVDLDVLTVRLTKYPPALATALQKMQGKSALAMGAPATAHLWLAPPLGLSGPSALSKIHVPLADRIAVLQEL